MPVKTITLQVDTDLAQAYQSAPAKDQTKLRLLLNPWLRELFARSTPLTTLMDELSDKAEARGLTAEKLEGMLRGPILAPLKRGLKPEREATMPPAFCVS